MISLSSAKRKDVDYYYISFTKLAHAHSSKRNPKISGYFAKD